jgi:hypothetical protein
MNLIIGLGTTGCAVARSAEQQAVVRRKAIGRRLASAEGSARDRLMAEATQLEHAVRFRAFDIDASAEYALPQMPGEDAGWPAGVFSLVALPGCAAVERIRSGDGHLVDFANPQALLGMDDPNASGGTRPNGNLAWQANADRVQAELRRDLHFLLARRQVRANKDTEAVRVIVAVGLFGGFGTGAWPALRSTLFSLSDEFGVRLDITPIFVVPGVHPLKDRVNSHGAAYGVLKETIAEASDYRWVRDTSHGLDCAHNERVRFRSPIHISDTNNAPNCPKLLAVENLIGMGGRIVSILISSPLGNLLESQYGDFTKAGARLTSAGESCHGRAIGLAEIVFQREQQFAYSSALAKLRVLDQASGGGQEDLVRREALAFLDGMNLGYAPLPQGCAGELMRRAAVARLSPGRFRSLFRAACDKLLAREILRTGRNRCDLARAQAGDFEAGVEQQARSFAKEAGARMAAQASRMMQDPAKGPAYALHWVRMCGGFLDAVVALYRDDSTALQERGRELSSRIEAIEEEFLEDARSAGTVWEFWNRERIEQAALAYRHELDRAGTTEMECQACTAAGHALEAVREGLQELWATLTRAQAALATARESLLAAKTAAAAESPDFYCPNGLALLHSEEDLIDLDRRNFSAEDRDTITAELFAAVAAMPEPMAVWSDAASLGRVLTSAVERSLLARKIDAIHVWKELEYRHGDPAALGGVLRERDLESYEWLPLNPGCRATVVRFAGMESQCRETMKPLLQQFATTRDTVYIPVETADGDRISFLQFRAAFALSEWRLMPVVRADYLLASRENSFEKHHVYPGERGLPDPGIRLNAEDRAATAVRATILHRLQWDEERAEWMLASADRNELPVALGSRMEALETQLGYRLAVDLSSNFTCHYMEFGPDAIRRALSAVRSGAPDGIPLGSTLCRADLASACRRIDQELDWWARNSVPATMEWARHQRAQPAASDGEAA